MKKTLSLTVSILLITCYAIAQQQTKKGRWLVMHSFGGFEYETEKTKTYNGAGTLTDVTTIKDVGFKSTFAGPNYGQLTVNGIRYESNNDKFNINRFAITLQPVAGIFIKDNFLLGASVLISVDNGKRTEKDGTDEYSTTRLNSLGLGPIARYYFGTTDKRGFFAGVESRYSFQKYRGKGVRVSGGTTAITLQDADINTLMATPHIGYAKFLGKRWSFELRLNYHYERMTRDNRLSFAIDGVQQTGYPQLNKQKTTTTRPSLYAGVGFSI
ncbi:MAG TPA: hypothetical protein VHM26_06275 [Chitinophagaceae bacterium]|nr:hypothetical protein [Chitinophagaceae bacterium]